MISSLKNAHSSADDDLLDRVFRALSDRTRRSILKRLTQSAATVSELAEPLEMSLPAASKHIKVLESAGLVKREKTGRVYICSFKSEPIEVADTWLEPYRHYWNSQLDELAEYFDREEDHFEDESE